MFVHQQCDSWSTDWAIKMAVVKIGKFLVVKASSGTEEIELLDHGKALKRFLNEMERLVGPDLCFRKTNCLKMSIRR